MFIHVSYTLGHGVRGGRMLLAACASSCSCSCAWQFVLCEEEASGREDGFGPLPVVARPDTRPETPPSCLGYGIRVLAGFRAAVSSSFFLCPVGSREEDGLGLLSLEPDLKKCGGSFALAMEFVPTRILPGGTISTVDFSHCIWTCTCSYHYS